MQVEKDCTGASMQRGHTNNFNSMVPSWHSSVELVTQVPMESFHINVLDVKTVHTIRAHVYLQNDMQG
jgi:hypothetical protein